MERNTKIKLIIGSAVFLTGAFLIYKTAHAKAIQTKLAGADDTSGKSNLPIPPAKLTPSTTSSGESMAGFPLKYGSKGEYVKQLQSILGVSADGIFGQQTKSALYKAASVYQIDSLEQMQDLANKLKEIANAAAASAHADQIYTDWTNNQALQILATGPATGQEVTKDAYGAYHYGTEYFTLQPPYKFNRDDFQITDTTKKGKLIIYVAPQDKSFSFDATNLTLA